MLVLCEPAFVLLDLRICNENTDTGTVRLKQDVYVLELMVELILR